MDNSSLLKKLQGLSLEKKIELFSEGDFVIICETEEDMRFISNLNLIDASTTVSDAMQIPLKPVGFRYTKFGLRWDIPYTYCMLYPNITMNQFMDYKSPKIKPMRISKTKTIKVHGVEREVRIVVLIDNSKVRAGYAIKLPSDKNDKVISETIATGRAMSDRSNMVDMEIGKGMNEKYILHAIADNLFNQIEWGRITVKPISK